MIKFHPDENILTEYAAGNLDPAVAIAVKTHIALCPKCRNTVAELKQVGAMFFEQPAAHTKSALDEAASFLALMARIKNMGTEDSDGSELRQEEPKLRYPQLPAVVNKLLSKQGKLKWQFISTSLKQANLVTGQDNYEVCLHKIRRGGKVAEHDHRGREVTVVLDGAFSDESGTYRKGDFLIREPGDTHRPTATQDQDCLCLSVVEAPVKLTGIIGKIINPFLRISPA